MAMATGKVRSPTLRSDTYVGSLRHLTLALTLIGLTLPWMVGAIDWQSDGQRRRQVSPVKLILLG